MHQLLWTETSDGFAASGYRIYQIDDGRWRLHSAGPSAELRVEVPPRVSWHTSAKEAMLRADQLEREELRNSATLIHFLLAVAALAAFVLLSSAIGSLPGLAAVSVAFYVMLRSAANGVALLLKDAWGWTRLGPQRSSLLERLVWMVAAWRRRRMLWASSRDGVDDTAVRPLEPVD